MLKLSDNPPSRPAHVENVSQMIATWQVVQTKARAEKALAWALHEAKTDYFLPMTRKVTFSGGRKRVGMHPLFPGYIFINSNSQNWHFGVASRHMARIIRVPDQGMIASELAGLEKALVDSPQALVLPKLAVGDLCRVTSGPLQGVVGVAVELNGLTHVVLNVSILGNGAAVPVEASLLERVV